MTETRAVPGRMDEIMKSLEEGIRAFMETDAYRTYLRAVGRFHDYSVNNVLLIAMQRPDATLVAGYSTWKKHFRRNVKRGEKGIRIIAPVPVRVEKEEDRIDQYGNAYREKVQATVPRSRAVTVFDVSQTEGEPVPDISPAELTDRVKDYAAFLKAAEKSCGVPVSYIDIEGTAKGYYKVDENRICISQGMGEAQTVKTLIHEAAHSVLHNRENGGARIDPKTKEVQAESVAFAVCSRFGIDTSDYSFPYVSAWAGDKDLKVLKDSMDTIRDTASLLIRRIEENYREQIKEPARPAKGAER